MSPDSTPDNRPGEPRPRPNGESGERSGDRSRSRRRSSRGGRSRSGASGAAQAQPAAGSAPAGPPASPAPNGRPPQGGARPGGQNPGGQGQGQGRGGGQAGQGGGGGENRNRSQGGRRGPEGGERGRSQGQGGGRPANADSARNQNQQQEASRAKRRDAERDAENIPNLTDWSFEHAGYTAWMAHAQILPTLTPQRAIRSYIVDIHAGEDAVNPRLWPAIQPFLGLEVVGPTAENGARALAETFRRLAGELDLPPAADYLRDNPPVEAAVSSPVQAALDTALPLDLDHPQEDIDIMNEGRKGSPLPRRD